MIGADEEKRMAKRRKYDIVLLGATGFTGQLTAEYLVNHGGADLKWALAGRSLDKLKPVRARLADLNPAAASLDLLQVDVDDVARSGEHPSEPVPNALIVCRLLLEQK